MYISASVIGQSPTRSRQSFRKMCSFSFHSQYSTWSTTHGCTLCTYCENPSLSQFISGTPPQLHSQWRSSWDMRGMRGARGSWRNSRQFRDSKKSKAEISLKRQTDKNLNFNLLQFASICFNLRTSRVECVAVVALWACWRRSARRLEREACAQVVRICCDQTRIAVRVVLLTGQCQRLDDAK